MSNIKRTIGIIEGEGIGPEIVKAAHACLSAVEQISSERFSYIWYDGPAPTQRKELDTAYEGLKSFYADARDQGGVILRSSLYASLVYRLRTEFNMLYKLICLEPVSMLSDISPLKNDIANKIKLLLVRDNAQGLYHGDESLTIGSEGKRTVTLTSKYEEDKIQEIARIAFTLANQNRKRLILLIKGDVLTKLADLWLDVFQSVGKQFPQVSFDWDHPDPGLTDLFIRPEEFDVVVALDVDADIIGDFLAGLLHGTRAITPSGNFDPASKFASYQTIHGSADSLAHQNKANPIGMIMAAAMLLELSFDMPQAATIIRTATMEVLREGYRTSDIFPRDSKLHKLVGTKEMTDLIVHAMRKQKRHNT